MKRIKKYIGNKEFYLTVFSLIIPIMIQQLFVSIAGYVDNLMINNYGGSMHAYNGVSAANRLMFVCNFVWMGFASSASIFIAQYFGAKKEEKVKEAIVLSVIIAIVVGIISMLVIQFFGNYIVNSFVQEPEARAYGYQYLKYLKYGTVIISINIALGSAFRSVRLPFIAMIASIVGIIINIFLNWGLIFGNLGFPELGAGGAAIATIISKTVELLILIVMVVFVKEECFKGLIRKVKVSKEIWISFFKKAVPLVSNELLWSLGMILFAKYYTYQNDVWYNAYGYSQNISDLFFIVFAGLGTGTAVIIGNRLGKGEFEEVEKEFYHFRGLGIIMGLTVGGLMFLTAPLTSMMFTTEPVTQNLVIGILRITAVFTAVYCYNSVSFFTLRAGGDSFRAFVLDQAPTYLIGLPICMGLGMNAKNLGLSIIQVYFIAHILDVSKIFLGNYFIRKKRWLQNLTTN